MENTKEKDMTPFFVDLWLSTLRYVARYILLVFGAMTFVAIGAWLAFCYLSDEEETEGEKHE